MQFLKRLIWGDQYARVRNDAGERIETLRFVVPALRVGVLEYPPGQLETGAASLQGKTVKLYYPPEALKDKKFLKSLENAPIVLGGHGKATSENNKDIDGWPRAVHYDESKQAVIVDGTVKGKKEAEYIRNNYSTDEFGASAFIDIYGMKIEEGVTPDGEPYNAIATKMQATHLALAPSVRDPGNKIEIVNSVAVNSTGSVEAANMREVEIEYSDGSKTRTKVASGATDKDIKGYFKIGEKVNIGGASDKMVEIKAVRILNTQMEGKMEIDEKALSALVKNAVDECLTKNAEGEELDKMKAAIADIQAALKKLTEAAGSEETERKEEVSVENEDEKKGNKEEGATLENAKPSQKLIAAFATAYNMDFGRSTPSFKTLGALAGVKAEDPGELITAVNAKFKEFGDVEQKKESLAKPELGFGGF